MAPKKRVVNRRDDADVPAEGLRLWAPWRYAYLRSLLSDPKACIFCFAKLSDAERRERLVLFENRDVLVMLNKYPYSNGHIMVAPRSHVASLELLSRTDRAVLIDAVAASIKLMPSAGVQRRRQPWQRRRCRIRGTHALAYRAAMDRRQQFHVGTCLDARAVTKFGGQLRAAAADFQKPRR